MHQGKSICKFMYQYAIFLVFIDTQNRVYEILLMFISKDKELVKLSFYLKKISKLNDLSHLNHRHWMKYEEE